MLGGGLTTELRPKLEVTGMTVRYGSGTEAVVAVDSVNLTVPPGGTLGLVGESGCGKSTIARAIVGLIPISHGTISVDGQDCSSSATRNSRKYRRRVQMVFQNPYSSLNPRMTVADLLQEAVGFRGEEYRPRSVRRREALKVLDLVGLSVDAFDCFPHQFSGGQRQRIAIARALAVRPELIIADEVTSALDVSVQATILNLLKSLQHELQISYLFISHDLSVIRLVSDEVAVMYLGRIVEQASSHDLFHDPRHPYTRALISSIPSLDKPRSNAALTGDLPDPRHPPQGCRFHSRCPEGPIYRPERQVCITRDPQSETATREHSAACHFAPNRQSISLRDKAG